MGRLILILLLILAVPTIYAEEWQYTTSYMTVDVDVTDKINIFPLESNWEAQSIETKLSLYPRERETQIILNQETSPSSEETDDYLLFEWEDVQDTELNIGVYSTIRLEENRPEIKEKVVFPIDDIPSSYEKYIDPTEKIESDDYSITQTASSIVEGEDDLFEAVYLIGKWVEENVEYRLDEYTESDVQSAKWVFAHRYGACDEISNLFIAMTRSLGIPARYVAGYAYTNLDNLNDFGSHAWAEVYFPEYGWVPFDVTYGQFGFTDISHINMGEKMCSSEGAITTTALGRNIQINAEQPESEINIVEKTGTKNSDIDINANVLEEEVDFGSYNLVYADIKNLKDYYILVSVYISNNEKLELFSGNEQYVMLKPEESKRIFWKVKISENLDEDFYYNLPLQIYTLDGKNDTSSITTRYGRTFLSEQDVESVISDMSNEEEKEYSKEINITCESNDFAYIGENVNIICLIRNTGNVFIKDLNVCIDTCQKIDIGIGRDSEVEFESEAKENMKVSAKNSQVSKTDYLDIEILDYPNIAIENIVYPENVNYEDVVYINFSINRKSISNPLNVKVNMANLIEEYSIDELENNQKINVEIKGKNLEEGNNTIRITADYQDLRGNKYSTSQEIIISLDNLSIGQKIGVFFNKFNRWLNNLFG